MMDKTRSDVSHVKHGLVRVAALALALLTGACGDVALDESREGDSPLVGALRGLIGGEGGELVGPAGTPLAGLRLSIPKGALKAPTQISLREATPTSALPASAVQVGRSFALEPTGLTLTAPAALTVPFDEAAVAARSRLPKDVRLWVFDGARWGQQLQQESRPGEVTVRLDALAAAVTPGLEATP